MSVLKSVIDVNNGNSGWTAQNVMDALETALGNLGYHAEAAQFTSTLTGVPQVVMDPNGTTSVGYLSPLTNLVDANGNDYPVDRNWGVVKTHKYRVTELTSSSTVSMTTNSGDGSNYTITGTGRAGSGGSSSTDPNITIYLGDTITFDNSALGGSHPMYIRVSDGGASVSNPAATGEGTNTVSWTPTVAGTYYYQCGVSGHQGMIGTITVSSVATDSYRVEKYVEEYLYNVTFVDTTNDEIRSDRHGFSTGDAVRYAKGQTDTAYDLGTTITKNTIYYIIKVNRDRFSLATTLSNANNGVKIDIDGYTTHTGTFECFTQEDQGTDYVNPNIDIYYGDSIQFENDNANATNFTLCRDVDSFDTNQRIVYNDATYGSTPADEISVSYRTNVTNISCAPGTDLTWLTRSYEQSESEPTYPTSITNPSFTDIPGEDGTKKYIYCSETNGNAKGVINILPGFLNTNWNANSYPYWKYTVPASGGRSELKLRVWRYGYNNGTLRAITIHSIGTGWSDDEVFTIPGELVGGTATTGDIRFGVPTPETSSNAYDGIAGIKTTTIGGGSNFYQKHDLGRFAILNVENDANKKYSNTFYAMHLTGDASSAWNLNMQCGNGWEFLNHKGTNSTFETPNAEWGHFDGYDGLDKQYVDYVYTTGATNVTMSTNSTPTAYPMQIKTFRAQAPQDTDFAVIQFTQTINEKSEPFGAFNFHVGDGYGTDVFDLDEVFLGGITEYIPTSQYISVRTEVPSYANNSYSTAYSFNIEPINQYSQARNAYYGYMRGYNSSRTMYDNYYNNIREDTTNATSVYYRNSTYDKYNNMRIVASADYYKPIKTIPISLKMIPCPYYIPDDFVLLQVATSPGLTEFRPGDTVTVSGSEIYEVIQAAYMAQQTGLDGVTNNSSEGMLFLARTT
jgi:plastocyanin